MSSDVMASFFDPSLDAIINKAREMLVRAGDADVIVLVGGFSGSHYAMKYLRRALESPGRPVMAPSYGPRAVLEGRWWSVKCSVSH
jgi:esterase/lipase